MTGITSPHSHVNTEMSGSLSKLNEECIAKNEDCYKRLRQLYPFAEINELPLSWSPKDKANYISLADNNRKAHYKGNGKNPKDAASVRATHFIPQACLLYYFEIKIISKGRDGYMGIGLAAHGVNMQRLPGWDKQSYGYHGDDGHSFCSSGTGQSYGPTFTTGDIIGCGYNLIENNCFYTKNGLNVGIAFTDLPNTPLFPTVGLQTPGEEVEANFGQQPFRYNIEEDIKALRQRITKSIIDFPVKYNEWQTMINKLVQKWLIHNGYCSTAEVFSSATKQEFKENVHRIKQRLRIQKLVLSGRIGDAIEYTNRLYPDVLQEDPDLLFALKCRQFVEMIRTLDHEQSNYHHNQPPPPPQQQQQNQQLSKQQSSSANNSSIASCSSTSLNPIINPQPSSTLALSINTSSSVSNINSGNTSANVNQMASDFAHSNGVVVIGDLNGNSNNSDKMDIDNDFNNENNYANNNNIKELFYDGIDDEDITHEDNLTKLHKVLTYGRDLNAFSQQLKKQYGTNEKNKQLLQDAFSLLAYSDPFSSPVGWQLDPKERETVCQQLNNAIVLSEKQNVDYSRRPPLETIMKHTKALLRLNGQCGAWLMETL